MKCHRAGRQYLVKALKVFRTATSQFDQNDVSNQTNIMGLKSIWTWIQTIKLICFSYRTGTPPPLCCLVLLSIPTLASIALFTVNTKCHNGNVSKKCCILRS